MQAARSGRHSINDFKAGSGLQAHPVVALTTQLTASYKLGLARPGPSRFTLKFAQRAAAKQPP